MDFWFEFDNLFLFKNRAPQTALYRAVFGDIPSLRDSFISHQENGTLYTEFKANLNKPELQRVRDSIRLVADKHLEILNRFFGNNATLEQSAFEYFGQGSLFDARRELDNRMHMMDRRNAPQGFLTWHSFIRSVMILGFSIDSNRWLQLDRHVALAGAIDSIVQPIQSEDPPGEDPRVKDPTTNRIDPAELNRLRAFWLTKNVDEIDSELIELGIE